MDSSPHSEGGLPKVGIDKITFAGEEGRRIIHDLQMESCGVISIEDAHPAITRGENGALTVHVTRETIDLLAGRVQITKNEG